MTSSLSSSSFPPKLEFISHQDLPKYITNFPSITNLVAGPLGMLVGIKNLFSSVKSHDIEGKKSAIFHISSCFIAFIHAAKASFGLINEFVHKYTSSVLMKQLIAISATFLCVIESIIELRGLFKQALFQSKMFTSKDLPILKEETDQALDDFIKEARKLIQNTDVSNKEDLLERLKTLETDKNLQGVPNVREKIEAAFYLRNFSILQKSYFPHDLHDKKKSESNLKVLQKRLQPWLYNQMLELVEGAKVNLEQLVQTDLTKTRTFFDNMRSQSKKAIIIHSIALASLGITIGSVIVSAFALPILIPFTLSAISFLTSSTTTILQMGLLPAKGNQIDWELILPDFIRKKLA